MNRSSQNKSPIAHANCVAAMEIGAATTNRKRAAMIARSSHTPSGPGAISRFLTLFLDNPDFNSLKAR